VSWPWEIVERDHQLQNPTSPEKILLLGDYLRLTSESRVLDIACGKAGPAQILAATYRCRIVGIERLPAFADEGRERVAAAGLDALIEIRTADAAEVPLEPEAWDAALCLGASFVWGTMAEAAPVLARATRPDGFVAIGEPFWRGSPPADTPPADTKWGEYADLPETVERFERAGLALTGLIASSDDDWDHYESLHWRAVEEWLAGHPDDPIAPEFLRRHEAYRRDYIHSQRALLGWAILVGRKG
jgi:SAM-dependent methyltransferase